MLDVQSAELTVKETILFSAQLRLDAMNPVYEKPGGLDDHIDSIMEILELKTEAEILVGNEEDGGLTFEQKKRLSIAVELAASPSIIFLDEPTSGLDARTAFIVMRALRKLCDTGRTVVATIHQPSSTVFDMFDDLLLLRKGGETVFFGDLGACSRNLVGYFEALGATPMNRGENPATWMLNVLGEKVMVDVEKGEKNKIFDFAKAWIDSSNYADLRRRLAEATESQDGDKKIKYETEFAVNWLRRDNLVRHDTATFYGVHAYSSKGFSCIADGTPSCNHILEKHCIQLVANGKQDSNSFILSQYFIHHHCFHSIQNLS
jgi:ABC-type multidrug transport system ATPase subunit